MDECVCALFYFVLLCSKCPPRTLLEFLDKIDGWMVGT